MTHRETTLTPAELSELADHLAAGHISRSCRRARLDWFNLKLSSGRRATGKYRWDSEGFISMRVR